MSIRLKAWNIGLVVLGVVIIVVAIIWRTVIFPAVDKLPTDHHQIINFEGTYFVMNAATRSLDQIPVKLTREQTATEVRQNVLLIKEVVTTKHALSGDVLPQFGQTNLLAVDRSTRKHVPGYGDMDRQECFAFPESVTATTHALWNPAAGRALDAKYMGKEEFRGITVFLFQVSEKDIPLGHQAQTGLPQTLDTTINLKVEPVSGTTVLSESDTTIKVTAAPGMQMPVYRSIVKFADDTVAELVNTAKSARTSLLWSKVYGFWLGISVGIVIVLAGVLGGIRARGVKEKA